MDLINELKHRVFFPTLYELQFGLGPPLGSRPELSVFDKITLSVPKGPNKTRDRCEHLEGSLLVLLKFPFPGIYAIPSVFCPPPHHLSPSHLSLPPVYELLFC